jgi:hypothetical protein
MGVRFCTLPDSDETRPMQPPTVITAAVNPIMGHVSAAYAVKIGRDLAVGTRCARIVALAPMAPMQRQLRLQLVLVR